MVLLLNNVFYPQQTSKKSTGTVKSKKSGSKGRSKSPGKAASAKSKPSSSRSKSSRKGGPIGLEGAVSDRMFVCYINVVELKLYPIRTYYTITFKICLGLVTLSLIRLVKTLRYKIRYGSFPQRLLVFPLLGLE